MGQLAASFSRISVTVQKWSLKIHVNVRVFTWRRWEGTQGGREDPKRRRGNEGRNRESLGHQGRSRGRLTVGK